MASYGRNLWIAAALAAGLAIGAALLPGTGWICGLAVLLGLAGVVMLRGNRWRSGALLVAALAVAIGLLDLFAGLLAPQAHGVGLVTRFDPPDWMVPDPDLGYRPRPDTKVSVTATYGSETAFHATYTILPDGTRATPDAPADADTYLFVGDSFMFGQGLADDQTLPAQFARDQDFKVKSVLFAAPGYAPNQFVRAFEAGRLDRLKGRKVKAVVTWIIPPHLARVTGEESWLGSSPRYALVDGQPRYTGSFEQYRWRHPIDGLHDLADRQFPFIAALGQRARQQEQAALLTALMMRLQALAREKLDAPLIVLYSWPDEQTQPGFGGLDGKAQAFLVSVLAGLRQRGLSLVMLNTLTYGMDPSKITLPHDGHPSAFANGLFAAELKKRLNLP